MKKRIYLYKSGTLQRQDNSIVFISGEEKTYIPIYQVETINVFNHCDFNKNTLLLLSKTKLISIYLIIMVIMLGHFQENQNN